ncbi:AAA-like domain-containing protein [Anaerolineales bacterium HSG24]|nr:AAA-like domain-containing protein [Anaerolineales bacterium HSG24]
MRRKFNDTGLCVSHRHYMVDTSHKIEQIIQLVEEEEYFTINRPRQFGKTTTLLMVSQQLNQRPDYLALNISFEALDTATYQKPESFIYEFLMTLLNKFEFLNQTEQVHFIEKQIKQITTIPILSRFITKLVRDMLPRKSVVLLIDEVDKSTNNQLFLDFLGMLRYKYLQRDTGQDYTFQSVILAGVHDIKTLKSKIRPDGVRSYNSPWNIAIDFEVDLSFAPNEIETMLQDYRREKQIQPDIPVISEKLYYYTSGYPYLVSKLCKFIDEKIIPQREDKNWYLDDVEVSFNMIVAKRYTTTLFDSLTKNLENNEDLYELVFQIIINGKNLDFAIANPLINLAHLYGIIVPSKRGHCQIHNRIFEQRIYDYMLSKFLQAKYSEVNGFGGPEFYTDEGLNVKLILQRFQTFMKEHYSNRDVKFLEREGRLLFLAYLRPIINGRGFDFKEPVVGDERRMDLVITYQNKRYVIELKRWYGSKKHQEGLDQLSDYLDTYSLKEGGLLIYDFRKKKEYKQEQVTVQDKQIFAVWV